MDIQNNFSAIRNYFPDIRNNYNSNVTGTEVWSASFGLLLHAQHIFANSFNFLVTLGLPVTVFHSTCILSKRYGTVLATGQHCSYMRVRIVCSLAGTWRPLVSAITTLLHCCEEYFS